MAEKTRRAYGLDVGELAVWADGAGVSPDGVGHRVLRRYAAHLAAARREGGRALSHQTVARKLAAIRSFYGHMVERGALDQNPADLVPSPRRPRGLPRAMRADEVARLLDRIPARTPLETRDRALFEIAYSCGLRCEELVNLDLDSVDFDAEELRVLGKGSKTRLVPVGEPAQAALERYLATARPTLQRDRAGARIVRVEDGPPAVRLGRAPPPAALAAGRQPRGRDLAARPATLFRHPPARGRRGPAHDPGAAGPRQFVNDTALHSGRVGPVATSVRKEPPAGVAFTSFALFIFGASNAPDRHERRLV